MNLRLRPFSTSLTLSLLLAANTVAAAAPFNRVRVPTGAQKITSSLPVLELSGVGSSLDFGQVQVAQQATSSTLVVSNKGKWTATALDVLAPAGFDVVDNDCGTELNPGSSCSFAVTFAPAQSLAYSGEVAVESSNGVTAQLRVDGVGVGAAVKLSDINFGNMMNGDQLVQAAVLRNIGVGPVRLGAPNVSGPGFTLAAGSTCGSMLPAGANCILNVGLTAAGVTAHAGTLTVPTMEAGDLQASLTAQSRQTFSINQTVTKSGSVTVPAGVSSVTLIGKGGPGGDTRWYDPGQPAIAAKWDWASGGIYNTPRATSPGLPSSEPAKPAAFTTPAGAGAPSTTSTSWQTYSLVDDFYMVNTRTWNAFNISPGQYYVAPTSGGSIYSGTASAANLGGQAYTFSGGYGGAATAKTYTKTLTAGPAQTLSFTIGSGGSLNYQYSYTLPY